MRFYTISLFEYDDYDPTIIAHEKQFTRKEFIDMYNHAVELDENKSAVVDYMCDKYGFVEVKSELEINTADPIIPGYGLRAVYCTSDIDGTDDIRLGL